MATPDQGRFSRRQAIFIAGAVAASAGIGRWLATAAQSGHNDKQEQSLGSQSARPGPDEALKLLNEGNQRWVTAGMARPNQSVNRRIEVAAGQRPWAVIFSCIDSRVPPELVFDRGLGDMFVVRTAGHVIDNAALGSIEFGVEEVHVPLVVVLGHERCGAVVASIEAVEHNVQAPGHIANLVDGIRPAIAAARHDGDVTDNVVRQNTMLTVAALKAQPILADAISHGAVRIVGARYDLDTGAVDWIA